MMAFNQNLYGENIWDFLLPEPHCSIMLYNGYCTAELFPPMEIPFCLISFIKSSIDPLKSNINNVIHLLC